MTNTDSALVRYRKAHPENVVWSPESGWHDSDRHRAIEAGHVWTDFNGCEEHVCVLPLDHDGPCRCECRHDSEGRYSK